MHPVTEKYTKRVGIWPPRGPPKESQAYEEKGYSRGVGPIYWAEETQGANERDAERFRETEGKDCHCCRGSESYIHLRRLGGTAPQKYLRWGDGPCICPPIFWEALLSDVRQSTNWRKKGVKEEFFVLNSRFLVKKRIIMFISDSRQ